MSHSEKLHALCASARIANIPSVAGNVWLGIALAATLRDAWPDGAFWVLAAVLGLAGVSFYLAGCFLNDWADRDWDAAHRPERALPQALLAPGFYLSVALVFGALGICLAAAVHRHSLLVALLIVSCIVLYTRVHKRSAWSVVPLGLCRALLPVLGFVGCAPPGFAPFPAWCAGTAGLSAVVAACACGLLLHVAGLSLCARYETMDAPPAGVIGLSRMLFPASAIAMFLATWWLLSFPLLFCVLGLLPYGLWMGLGGVFFPQVRPDARCQPARRDSAGGFDRSVAARSDRGCEPVGTPLAHGLHPDPHPRLFIRQVIAKTLTRHLIRLAEHAVSRSTPANHEHR